MTETLVTPCAAKDTIYLGVKPLVEAYIVVTGVVRLNERIRNFRQGPLNIDVDILVQRSPRLHRCIDYLRVSQSTTKVVVQSIRI